MMNRKISPTYRLAASYFIIILVMSLLFSAIIYFIASSQLGRPLPARKNESAYTPPADIEQRITERDNQTRISMLGSLAILNIIIAAGGAGLSYYLARRTLRPIEESIEAQAQFVSDASHELRTPLTAIQVSNEVALRKSKLTEDKAREVLRHTIAETEKLHQLTNMLLRLANSDKQSSSLKTIQLESFVQDVLHRVRPLAEKKKILVEVDVPAIEFNVHTSELEQILTILLDNALKYSPEKSTVTVSGIANAHLASLSVRDEGIGISKKEQAKIFERFYRGDKARTRSETSGHGLGLAIAKQLADSSGYTITCESEAGNGSMFTLDLQP